MKQTVSAVIALAAALACMHVVQAAPRQRSEQAALTPAQTLDRRAIGDLEFSPDGSRLVFTVTEPVKGTARARALWLLDVASGQLRPLTFSGKSDGSPRWAPDGASIAFVSDRDGAPQLYRLSMRGGEADKLTDRKEAVGAFRWSPDGTRIALLMAEPKPDAQQKREREKDDSRVVDKDNRRARVWLLDVASRHLTQVTSGGWQIGQIEWLPSGDRLIAAADAKPASDQWHEHLYSIGLTGGQFTEIGAPRGPLGPFARSPDGKTIAYVGARASSGTLAYAGETATTAPELWIKMPNTPARAVTRFNEKWASLPVAAPELVKYKSADGVEIEAALLQPSAISDQPLAISPCRSSSSFTADRRDDGPMGIGGWSYGGYMAAWAVTQTTRFKAAVSGAPVIDMASEFGTEGGSAYDEWFYGTPYEKLDGFIKSSPMTFVRNAKTPTLLLQGEDDTTDPIGQSQQFYRRLKRYGVDADFVLYPREPHGLREEQHLLDRLNRIIAWYDKYLKPAPASTAPQP